MRHPGPLTYAAVLCPVSIWGAAYVIIPFVQESIPPLALAAVRCLVAAGILSVYLAVAEGDFGLSGADLLRLSALGFVGNTLFQVSLNFGLTLTTPAHSALMVATMPIQAVLLARLWLGEPMPARRLLGVLTAFVGVSLIITRGFRAETMGRAALGDLLSLGAAACWAVYSVWIRPLVLRHSPLKLTTGAMVMGAVFLLPIGLADALRVPWMRLNLATWAGLLYLSLGVLVIGYVIWAWVMRSLPVSRVVVFAYLTPVVTMLLSALVYGEALTLPLLVGGALVIVGAAITQRA